jgi:hypothetical protein
MAKKTKKKVKKTDPVEEYKRVCRKHLILPEDGEYIEVIMGTVFANRPEVKSDPVWAYIIGPASCGKTEIIRSLAGHKTTHSMISLSRKSLINSIDNPESKTALLPMLDQKVFVIEDFTVMLAMRYDELHEILGYLRMAYDGKLEKHITGKGMVRWESQFGLVAAVTGAIDRHKKALVDLGERFVNYRMPKVERRVKRKRGLGSLQVEDKQAMREEIKRAAHKLLDTTPEVPEVSEAIQKGIVQVAEFGTSARAEVKRDKYSKDPEEPEEEFYERMAGQIHNLCRGIAMAHGRKRVEWRDFKIARKCGWYSATRRRLRLIRLMMRREWTDVEMVQYRMRLSQGGAAIQLEDLELVGLAERREVASGRGGVKFEWRLKDRAMLKRVLD